MAAPRIIVSDSVTKLDDPVGCVVVAASHGGRYAAYLAAKASVRAVILHDAGRGLDDAGVAGVDWLDGLGIAGAAVGHMTARIGEGADMMARGLVTHANRTAQSVGVFSGQPCAVAAEILLRAPLAAAEAPPQHEGEHKLRDGPPQVWALDSTSLIAPRHVGTIVVCGSHGGLLGRKPETASREAAFAMLFNDAGIGIDGAGTTRLPALEARGIGAGTYAAYSARIGEARSAWETGRVTVVNGIARGWGACPGMSVQEFADCAAAAFKERNR